MIRINRMPLVFTIIIFMLMHCNICALTWSFKPVTDPNEKATMSGSRAICFLGDKNLSIKVFSGAKFYTGPIAIVDGTIERESVDAVQGDLWFLSNGVLKNHEATASFRGLYLNADSRVIVLKEQTHFLNAGPMQIIESVVIEGSGKIMGQPLFSNTLTLSMVPSYGETDEILFYTPSSLNLGIQSVLNKDIKLYNGSIFLEDDLKLADSVIFDGSGTVSLNGYKITLGGGDLLWTGNIYWNNAAMLELNSTQTLVGSWIFDGNAHVIGNNHVVDLSFGGNIIVETAGTSLLLDDVTIKGLSGTNLRCLDDSCTISLRNVRLILGDDYTFDKGSIAISGDVVVAGQHYYNYMTNQQSIISSDACLSLEPGTIFHYEPSTAQKNLITMADSSAEIFLNNATLSTSTTGLQLKKGTITVDGKSFLCNDGAQSLSQGFVIGDGTSEGAVTINIMPAGTLTLVSGCLDYKNT